MAATVQIVEKNGAGPSVTDKTAGTIRFKNADNPTVDLVNPMVLPGAGSDWSFEKWVRFNVSGGTYTQIVNVRAYTDGASGWGADINLWWKAVTAYATPAEGTSAAGYTDGFTFVSGAPLTLGAGPFTGTGEKGDHLVMLAEVESTATGGLKSAETLTIAWDEI